jgi:predicted lipoprotein with Yx(FWY)xxD motif
MTRRNQIKLLAAAVLVATAATFTGSASAASRPAATVKVASSSLGRIIVDSHGRTLYLRTRDRGHTSSCFAACAHNWPPFTTRGKPRAIAGARRALLGTTRRKDGRIQVTYHGHRSISSPATGGRARRAARA